MFTLMSSVSVRGSLRCFDDEGNYYITTELYLSKVSCDDVELWRVSEHDKNERSLGM